MMPIKGWRISWTRPGASVRASSINCSRSGSVIAALLGEVRRRGGRRQHHGEGRAAPLDAVDQDLSVMGLDDAVGDGEAQARPLAARLLAAEEGIEDALAHGGRD